jgi:hypothetical protein
LLEWAQQAIAFLRTALDRLKVPPTTIDLNLFHPLAHASWARSLLLCPREVSERLDPTRQAYSTFRAGEILQNLRALAAWCQEQQGAGATPKARGRGQLAPQQLARYRTIKASWDRARGTGVRKEQFCADEGIDRSDLETILRHFRGK